MNNHQITKIDDCRMIRLRRHESDMGALTVAQNSGDLPFAIRRVYYIYDIPAGAERGGHSHHEEESLLVATSGCFDVNICDGREWKVFTLRNPSEGLYVPAGIWREMCNFSAGSVVLVLSSTKFNENDYVRDFTDFKKLRGIDD